MRIIYYIYRKIGPLRRLGQLAKLRSLAINTIAIHTSAALFYPCNPSLSASGHCAQEKVTKMVNVVGDIQERIPVLQRNHREMQQSLEHIAKTLQELSRKISVKN